MIPIQTIDQVAGQVREALRGGPAGRAEALRMVFGFVPSFDRAPDAQRIPLVAARPVSTSDAGFDALLAALVEHLAAGADIPAPRWVEDPDRFVEPWWFVSGMSRLHASALVQSPISFARRGVFICDGALSYA